MTGLQICLSSQRLHAVSAKMRWACRSGATRPALLRCIIARSSDKSSLAHSHLAFILLRPSASRRTGLTGKSNPFAVDLTRSSNAIIKLPRPLLSPSPFTCSLALGSLFLMPRQLRPLAFSTSSRCPALQPVLIPFHRRPGLKSPACPSAQVFILSMTSPLVDAEVASQARWLR